MKRCWSQSGCGFFCTTKRPGNAVMKASLSNDESCDDDKSEWENEKTEATSEDAKRVHCIGFEQMPEAIEEVLLDYQNVLPQPNSSAILRLTSSAPCTMKQRNMSEREYRGEI